jgi:hypothetical protein
MGDEGYKKICVGETRKYTQFQSENMTERNYFSDQGTDKRIILKCIPNA